LSNINTIFRNTHIRNLTLADISNTDIVGIDVAIITGVLIFLSLEGFVGAEEAQITLITANIVFPFAISAIAILFQFNKFGIRFTIAGFVNLMISVILIALMRLL
jgi:hypothetical protein